MCCDNQGAIALAKNPGHHSRSEHIAIQHRYVREAVVTGDVELNCVATADQLADGLTKSLRRDKFEAFRKALGLYPAH